MAPKSIFLISTVGGHRAVLYLFRREENRFCPNLLAVLQIMTFTFLDPFG